MSIFRNKSVQLCLRLLKFARRYQWLIVATILAMLVYASVSRGMLLIIQPLIDKGIVEPIKGMPAPPKTTLNPFSYLVRGTSPTECLKILALIIGALVVLTATLNYLKEYLHRYVTLKTLVDIRNEVCGHILHLPMRFFNEKKAGDLISRLTNDVVVTQMALEFLFGDIIQQPALIMMTLGFMFIINWPAALVIVVFLPLFGLSIVRFGRRIRKSRTKSLIKLGDITESMHQMFSGIRIVKSFRMEKEEMKEFGRENQGFFRKSMAAVRAKALSASIIDLIGGLGIMLVLFIGVYFIRQGTLTLGTAGAFFVFLIFLNTPIKNIAKSFNILQESLAGAERVFELMEAKPEIKDAPDAVQLAGINRDIRFNNVWFAYNEGPVLKDINLLVRPGQTVALVGPTGAGKSTLLDLVSRFYDPTQGSVEIDGINLRNIKRESLLDQIAVVTQETFLFNTSIRENISYGKREASLDEIIQAARAANIHDFITSLEKGYETEVGERGARLSGGERQRIAIARAILKDPQILLLDEATSALDSESERIVQVALNNLMKDRTTFVIAHRLSTVHQADHIIVLDNGRIIQQGRHNELIKQEGLYQRLYQMQFVVPEAESNR